MLRPCWARRFGEFIIPIRSLHCLFKKGALMERFTLSAESRSTGKGASRRARCGGWIPAIIYGKKREPLTVQVSEKELTKATTTEAGFNALFDLTLSGK